MDGPGRDPMFVDTNEEDDGINDKASINVSNINAPADGTTTNNPSNSENNAVQICHQKLEAK